LPVPSDDELGTIQELSSIQISSGQIGAIAYRFEEVRTLEMGARHTRIAAFRPSEVRTPKIRPFIEAVGMH
jgi:hypothetical protein